jgi:hypothetical protein
VSFDTKGRVVDFKREGYSNTRAVDVIQLLLERLKPDLVLFTGDIIDGRPFGASDATEIDGWRSVMKILVQVVLDGGAQWAFVPGNHDDDHAPWPRSALLGIMELPGCIQRGAISWDHTLTVGPTDQCDSSSSARLWFFDSGANNAKYRYDTFAPAAVRGFQALACPEKYATTKRDKQHLPEAATELGIFHIPLPEYAHLDPVVGRLGVFEAVTRAGMLPWPLGYWPLPQLIKALRQHRVVGCSTLNSGLFHAMLDSRVAATFCGHDHYNDAVMRRGGLWLCYGRVGSFTPPSNWEGDGGNLPFPVGARVVQLTPKQVG